MINATTSASQTTPTTARYDYNHDGVVNHDDVAYFISLMKNGSNGNIAGLLNFQRDTGGQVTIKDLLDFLSNGGKMEGSDVAQFVQQGGTLTQGDVDALVKAGVHFTAGDMEAINSKLGTAFKAGYPPGTTPQDLIQWAQTGEKVTVQDLLSLKGPDGKTLATGDDLVKLKQLGTDVKVDDLLALQNAGGALTGQHLAALVSMGLKLTTSDLATLSKGGMAIKGSDLATIFRTQGLTLTKDDYIAINPLSDKTGLPSFQNGVPTDPSVYIEMAKAGLPASASDMLSLKGPDGKPLATENELALLKEAGGTVTAADILAYQQAGGTVLAGTLQRLVNAGMPLTSSDLLALAKGGMTFNTDVLKSITNRAGIRLTLDEYKTINPIGYTTGKPVFQDGVLLKGSDYVAMAQAGVQITAQNLIDLAKAGGVVTSGDLAALADGGSVYFSGDDLVALGAAGVRYDRGDLMRILDRTGTVLTNDQSNAIAPYLV
jgi:hypothetical protein